MSPSAQDILKPILLHWDDQEMGTAVSWTKCRLLAGLNHKRGRNYSNV